jgi:spore coat polysaccharide biosynthesis protein SpsF
MNLAILQARIGSTRLPGKVLREVNGMPLLKYQCDRLLQSKKINKLIIATSIDKLDNQIEKFAKQNQISCYRGSLNNVLERYYLCAKEFKLNYHKSKLNIIRITGDCPIIDSALVDEVITYFEKNECDYASNTISPTFPDGMDVEVFDFNTLEIAYNDSILDSEREHVTPYIKKYPKFIKLNYASKNDYSNYRFTVDLKSDFELIQLLILALYDNNPYFSYLDAISYMQKNPSLFNINSHIKRDEGYISSLKEDIKK